jgi:hypothetical protein
VIVKVLFNESRLPETGRLPCFYGIIYSKK